MRDRQTVFLLGVAEQDEKVWTEPLREEGFLQLRPLQGRGLSR